MFLLSPSDLEDTLEARSGSLGVCPVLPKIMMYTLALVPAPWQLPVTVTTSYSVQNNNYNYYYNYYNHYS